MFCVSIWLLAHACLEWHLEEHILHSPSFPALCLWSDLAGFVSCRLVGVGWRRLFVQYRVCLCPCLQYQEQSLCLSQENWCTGMWILLLSPGHFVWLYQAQRSCNSDPTSKICFRGCIFHRSKVPTCYWCFWKFWVSLNFLHATVLLMACTDTGLHGSVIFWCGCKSNYFSSSKPVCVSESYIHRNTVQH